MKQLNIRKERLRRGTTWTQEYVGQQVGVTKQAIHDIETGKKSPSYDVLVKLENLFGLSHRYLLSQGSDHPDYSSSGRSGIAEAKELSEAAKGFEVDVETIVDVGEDGRLDCPERRKRAERLGKALCAALSA